MAFRLAQAYDRAYKRLLAEPLLVEALLRHFAPPDLVERLDFSTLLAVASESVLPSGRRRLADLIWRIELSGSPIWVLIMLEFQASSDAALLPRLLATVAASWERSLRQGQRPVPPVLPVVLYNGQRPWRAATDTASLLPADLPAGLRIYQPQFSYLLVDGVRLDFKSLKSAPNLMARLLALEAARDKEQLLDAAGEFFELVFTALSQDERRRVLDAFAEWFRCAARSDVADDVVAVLTDTQALMGGKSMLAMTLKRVLDEEREEGRQEGRQEGRREGRREGRDEGRCEGRVLGLREGEASLLLRQLRARFGRLPDWVETRLYEASEEELLRWAEAVLTARRLDDVFGPR